MRKVNFPHAAILLAMLTFATSAWAQDRNAFRNQSRQTAAQMRALGEPMDRCSFGGLIQQRRVIEVYGDSPLRVGDTFESFNGTDVSSLSDEQIIALARRVGPDAQISIIVDRAGEAMPLDVRCSNARIVLEPLLAALDQAARGRFEDCIEALAASDDSHSLTLKLGCASLTRRPEEAGVGDIAYRLAVRSVEIARAIPERRVATITQLRASEAAITSARGAPAFRELVDATRRWPGSENAWDRSEPDWAAFRRTAEVALRQRLIDPESARIEWPNGFLVGSWTPPFSASIEGYWTCGRINARNRMGGYTGSTSFVAVLSPEGQIRYVALGEARDFDFISMQCANSVRLLPPAPPALASASAPAQGAVASPPSIADELERLVRLRDSGALTATEFDAAKDRLLHPSPQ